MKGRYLLHSHETDIEHNIYADKSSLILQWLLLKGIEKKQFSIREVAREISVSIGLIQKVFKTLVKKGYLEVQGVRTAKKFILIKPKVLLESWLAQYHAIEKCKMWTYRSGFQNRDQILKTLANTGFQKNVVLALHSAVKAFDCKNTNLETLELYLMDSNIQFQIEKELLLEPQERGYEVLLIRPYYNSLLKQRSRIYKYLNGEKKYFFCSPLLLTFLDLYHFPLRGREQAEFMIDRIACLQRIYQKKR